MSVTEHRNPATESLLDAMDDFIESAAQKLSDSEFRNAEKQFLRIMDRALTHFVRDRRAIQTITAKRHET